MEPPLAEPDRGSDDRGRSRRWGRRIAIIVIIVLALPIPWQHVESGFAPTIAWRLDGRLEIDGRAIDPPGKWSWLAVGRPQLVGEAIWNRVVGTGTPARDMRGGLITRSPALTEPAAAAIGLRAAGRQVPLGLIIEVRGPLWDDLPERAIISTIDGVPMTNRAAWRQTSSLWEEESGVATSPRPESVVFTLPNGLEFTGPGPGLPYRMVNTLDAAPVGLEAGITFQFARRLPVDWFRNLSLGSSHGAMVALLAYVDASGHDLAQGRHIAGTGGIRGDGSVTRIGRLPEKAKAAQRAGANVLIFPASQAAELEGESFGRMTLLPVNTLDQAIEWLERPVPRSRPIQ